MAPQSRGGTTSTGAQPHVRGLQTYSLSTPNLRTLSSALDSSPVHQRQNGDFVIDDDIDGGEDEDGDTDDADFQRHYSLDGPEDSEEEEEGDDGDEDEDPERQRPHRPSFRRSASDNPLSSPTHQTLQHHSSFPNNPNHHFAPPFYNRPPTPLPPSPSLTSLLRPPFSSSRPASSPSRPTTRPSTSSRPTATPPTTSLSRPTTPVSTSDEDTEAAVARAETVPRVSPKVPTYEYYGFVLYLVSSVFFCKALISWKENVRLIADT
jgi:phosphatidylinositol N-acetylglucosaminyltransferase subunit P